MSKQAGSNPGALDREAARLLGALEVEGACAGDDPAEAGWVVVRQRRGTVSLAAGRYRLDALRALQARGLAEPLSSGAAGLAVISAAGRAHLRRRRGRADERFRGQHGELVDAEVAVGEGAERVRFEAAESPLAWLRRRKGPDGQPLIDAVAFEAGERLRRDLTLGHWLPGVTVNWSAPAGGAAGPRDPAGATDAALAARQRVTAALEAVGPDLSGLLVDLCGFLKGLEQAERERGWPPRSAKVVATLALNRLADHYGLEREARGPEHSRGVRAWRPTPS